MRVWTGSYGRDGWLVPLPSELDSPSTLVVAFGASRFLDDPAPLLDLAAAFPRSKRIGCSTAGEIVGARVFDDSVVVGVAAFERTELRTAFAPIATGGASFDAGKTVAAHLARPDLRAVLVLSDGHDVNGSELIAGLNAVLPVEVVVTGGLAGDGTRFRRTWVLGESGAAEERRVSAVGLYGEDVCVGHGSKGGWDIFGVERRVTRSRGNVLYELDGRPALALYKQYLGERAAGLPATALLFPLAIREHAAASKQLVRTVLGVDETHQSLTFAGDVPEGWLAQLMRANFDRLIQGALDAATRTAAPTDAPSLAIAISCVGRRLVLGERAEEEIEATLEALPPGAAQIGFYSYGELSPFANGRCDLHNQTMTLSTLSER
jgi:hypothetical protein